MSVDTFVKSGSGNAKRLTVNSYDAVLVSVGIPDILPSGTENRRKLFIGKTGSEGTDSGTTNMNVNGVVTSQSFYVGASTDFDIYVTGIGIMIADSAVTHNSFGNVSALANGWDLNTLESGILTGIIIKAPTGGEVIAQTGGLHGFGNAAGTWRLDNRSGNTDAQLIYIPINMWVPGGIRLGRGTNDKIESVVNDDLTGLTEFVVRCFGYRLEP